MPQCFRCGSTAQATDIKCKTCGAELKAFGHQGIELHRTIDGQPLCLTCVYHADDSCDYDKRPFATECTMYRDVNRQVESIRRPGARQSDTGHQKIIIVAVILGLILLAIVMR